MKNLNLLAQIQNFIIKPNLMKINIFLMVI